MDALALVTRSNRSGSSQSNEGQSTSWGSRLWSCGKMATGVLSAVASVGLVALRALNPWKDSPVLNGLTSVGIGASAMTALECLLPQRITDVIHLTSAKNAIILFFALWQGDLNATGVALAGIVSTLQACCGHWGVSKIVMFISGKRFDKLTPSSDSYRLLGPQHTVELLGEPDTIQSFIGWQAAKGVVCLGSGAIYIFVPQASVHFMNLSIATGSHIAGACYDRAFHHVKNKLEKENNDSEFVEDVPCTVKAMRYGSQFFYLFGNNITGMLFFWNHPGSYVLTFFFLGAMKSSAKRRFHKIAPMATSNYYVSLQKAQNIMDVVIATGFGVWYAIAMATPEGSTDAANLAERLGLTAFAIGIPAGFAIARIVRNRFDPGKNSKAFNSLLFYTRDHRVVFSIVPLYLLQYVQIDDQALNEAGRNVKKLIPQIFTWVTYATAFGIDWGQKYPIERLFSPILDVFAAKLLIETLSPNQ